MHIKKKIYVRAYLKRNLGDDLFVKILAERYPNEIFYVLVDSMFDNCFTEVPNIVVVRNSIFKKVVNHFVEMMRFRFLKKMKYKAFVEIGGSIFQQSHQGEDVAAERVEWLRSKIPYFTIGANFGPFFENSYLKQYQSFFKETNGIVFRDQKSYSLFSSTVKNVGVASDVVFGLKTDCPVKKNRIVVAPVDLSFEGRTNWKSLSEMTDMYEKYLADFCVEQIKRGYQVSFVSFCDYEGDSEAIRRILKMIPQQYKTRTRFVQDASDDFKVNEILEAPYMISSRYHAMILGWIGKTKQLVLPYSSKTINVIEDLFPAQYWEMISRVDNEDPEIVKKMNTISSKELEPIIRNSNNQFTFLDEFLVNSEDI